MSLVGTLEELGLGEILQIVSLSRKTGVLSLNSNGKEGSVFFRQGKVVRATASACQHTLGEVLIQKGLIDVGVLRKSLSFQQKHGFSERLGVILINNFGIPHEVIEEVVREQIENVVFSLFSWSDGTFRFDVDCSIETVDDIHVDPLQFMLAQGLNPQFLAMEGSRILDELRNADVRSGDDSSDETDFAFNLVHDTETPGASHYTVQQPVVLVDDDGPTLRAITDGLTETGFVVHAMARSEDTLITVDTLHRNGARPAVLIDLIMPKMDGSGVLGGLELLELLHTNFKDLHLLVMTDYHHADAERKIRELGYPYIIKPRRVEIATPAIVGAFCTKISHDIRYSSPALPPEEWHNCFNLGDELRIEMGEDDDMPRAAVSSTPLSGGFSLLRGMLEELTNPDLQGGVLLLVLRFASEFVNRAIVFTIQDRIISGFGQFGISDGALSGDERVRAIHFPQDSDSIFSASLKTGQPRTFAPDPAIADMHLFGQLGGSIPTEVFIGPLLSKSRVIGFLYGDNLPDNKPFGDVEPLAIFLSQAGIAMEKSVLERQLKERGTP
jgi:CheY-like chemotaxis protein